MAKKTVKDAQSGLANNKSKTRKLKQKKKRTESIKNLRYDYEQCFKELKLLKKSLCTAGDHDLSAPKNTGRTTQSSNLRIFSTSLRTISKTSATPGMKLQPCQKLNPSIKTFPSSLIRRTDKILGNGQFGTCTVGYFQGTRVCIKTYHEPSSSLQSVIKEANILSSVSHKALCNLQGVQIQQQPYFLVTNIYEIKGHVVTINDLLYKKQKTPLKDIISLYSTQSWCRIFMQLAQGLLHLHNLNIVHCDLKTDNVVFYEDSGIFFPVIIDFGKSRLCSETQKYTLTKTQQAYYRTNHRHIAPDLVDGVNSPSPASDVYSYGRMMRAVIVNFPISAKRIPSAVIDFIKSCIRYESSKRPTLQLIISTLKPLC